MNASSEWDRMWALFDAALSTPPEGRAAFLDEELGKAGPSARDASSPSNDGIRAQIEALLDAHEKAHGFLEADPNRVNSDVTLPLGASSDVSADSIDRYVLIERIGEGGFGVVYLAEQQTPIKRHVALKVIKLGMDTRQVIARFEAERQTLARMNHPHVAAVYDAGATGKGRPYFVMEHVPGEPITHYCEQRKLTIGERLELFVKVCAAIQHAHQKGIIHRDIKPSNILVRDVDGRPQPKVIDFGIAKATQHDLAEQTLTEKGQLLGTPAYMSPEQATLSAEGVDTRTDIYALGVLLYELLTSTVPFDPSSWRAGGLPEALRLIREADPQKPSARVVSEARSLPHLAAAGPDLRALKANLRGDLDWIVMRCLEKDRARRYASVSALADDVRRHLNHEPVHARPPSAVYRLRKLARRHRAAVTAGVVVLLALVTVATVSTYSAIRIRQQVRRQANEHVDRAYNLLAYQNYRDRSEALKLLALAEPGGPDPARFDRAKGFTLMLDDTGRAVEHLQHAVRLAPDDVDGQYLLAWALSIHGVQEQVDDWIARADAAGGPASAAGHFFRAQAIVWERPDEAVDHYRLAIATGTDYSQAMLHLGRAHNQWTYHYRTNDRFEEQQRYLQTACDLQPDRAYPRYLLSIAYRFSGEILEGDGQFAEAQQRYEKAYHFARQAQEVEPASARGYAAEAEYWETRGDYVKAIDAWDRCVPCISHRLSNFERLQYRWRHCYWTGDFSRAIDDLRDLAALSNEHDPKRMWYEVWFPALIEAETGDRESALQSVESHLSDETGLEDRLAVACVLRILGFSDRAESVLHHVPEKSLASADPGLRMAYEHCASGRMSEGIPAGPEPADRRFQAQVYFVDAARALGVGKQEQATRLFRQAMNVYDDEGYCYLAEVFLRRLENDPNWPNVAR